MSKDWSQVPTSTATNAVNAVSTRMLDNVARVYETQLNILNLVPAVMLDNITGAFESQLRILNAVPTDMLHNITGMYESQLRILNAVPTDILHNITGMYENQLNVLNGIPAGMLENITGAFENQLNAFAGMPAVDFTFVTDAYLSRISDSLRIIENGDLLRIGSADLDSLARRQPKQKLSDQEFSAWLTVVAFFIIYISYGTAIVYSSAVAEISAADGPTPFEAAMAVGALVFWVGMNRNRGSDDK